MINEKELITKVTEKADTNIDGKMYMSVDRLAQIIKNMPKEDPFYLKDSRFKELKPGMLIHFETNVEQLALLMELERLGYFWNGYGVRPLSHFLDDQKYHGGKKDRYIGLSELGDGTKIIFALPESDIGHCQREKGMNMVEILDLIIYEES